MRKFIIPLLLSFVTLTLSAQTEDKAEEKQLTPKEQKAAKKAAAKQEKILAANQKKEAKEAAKKALQEAAYGKTDGHVYVYACASEFGDSIVYISEIEKVDSMSLVYKTKFLPYRSDFSQQFKDYLEQGPQKATNQTVAVYFSLKKNSLAKTLANMKKRYLKKGEKCIMQVKEQDFKFVHPLDYSGFVSK